MDFHINPANGFIEIPIGTVRSKVRAYFSMNPFTKRSVPWDTSESDYYNNFDLRFSYEDEHLESIGFSTDSNVYLNSINFKGIKFKRIFKEMSALSYLFTDDKADEVFFNDEIGLSIFVDGKKIETFELYSGNYLERKKRLSERAELFLANKSQI